jgi:hypothetical protein
VSNLKTPLAPENTQKSSNKAFHRAYSVHHLVDGTGNRTRSKKTTHLPATPAKTAGLSNSDLSWHFHLAADGRWTRQMAESRKKALFDPALQTLGQEEAMLAASSALRLCEEDDHAVMYQVTSC